MDRDEAKNILQLCRPGNESDRNDPLIAAALALLDTDAELRTWFDAQQAFDATIAAELETIDPPADLKAAILAGMRAHVLHAEPVVEFSTAQEFPEHPRPAQNSNWWRNPWIGIAAIFVFMMVFLNVPRGQDVQLAQNDPALSGLPSVLPFLADQIDGMKSWSFDKRDDNATQLQNYLASTGVPSPKKLCKKMQETPTIGCVTFNYNGSKLSMICFKDGEVFHLITGLAADFPDACPKQPQVYQIKDQAFKVWVDGDQLNILTIHGTTDDIPEFI
jgi:hypothetical protein